VENIQALRTWHAVKLAFSVALLETARPVTIAMCVDTVLFCPAKRKIRCMFFIVLGSRRSGCGGYQPLQCA